MKNNNYKRLSILLILFIISVNAQKERDVLFAISTPTVDIVNMIYINGTPINNGATIEIETGSSTRIQFGIDVNNPNGTSGTLKVYTKRYSNDFEQQQGGLETIFSGSTFFGSSRDITLYASSFNSTGGFLYAEFKTTTGLKYISNTFPIAVIVSNDPAITNNTISGNQTINEGNVASTLIGSTPNGGNGSYSFQWQIKTTGSWSSISGSTSKNHTPNLLTITSKFRRIVMSGNANNSTSNEITINVIRIPPITNNTIFFNGTKMVGSTPSGGNNNFTYEWRISNSQVHDEIISNANQKDYTVDPSDIAYNSFLNNHFRRIVKSGSRTSSTGWVGLNQSMSLNNNVQENKTSNSKLNNESIKVFPNPTTKHVNFEIVFDEKAFIEISINSLNLRLKEILVYKGYTIKGKNIIGWDFPEGFKKGIYTYKIISNDNIVKTGKIILN